MSTSSNPLVRAKRTTQPSNPLRRPSQSYSSRPIKMEERGSSRPLAGTTQAPPSEQPSEKGTYSDFVLKSCNYDEVKDRRHHILRFHSKASVNPATDLTPPIRFHRKDPRNLQFQPTQASLNGSASGSDAGDVVMGGSTVPAPVGPDGSTPNDPSAAQSQSSVAPDGSRRKPNRSFQKKTRQVITGGVNNSEAAKKLRYEEYYPWVMEDFDGQNTWVGSYEAAQSDTYVLFVFDKDGFKMVPAEKWYKMTPRNKFATLTAEEAEERMEKKNKGVPRWIMKHLAEENGTSQANPRVSSLSAGGGRRLRTVDSSGLARPGGGRGGMGGAGGGQDDDHDEIDFDEEFADDEEAPIMEGAEEDVREVENKIKREQRHAKFINEGAGGMDNDEDDGMDGLFDQPHKIDKEGRKLRKYLQTLEKNANYDSDDDEFKNPYMSEDEEEDDDGSEDDAMDIKTEDHAVSIKREDVLGLTRLSPPIVKKEYTNLPPGMVILQLRPQTLAAFPRDVWNPNAKRRHSDDNMETSFKKIKITKPNGAMASSPGGSPSAAGSPRDGVASGGASPSAHAASMEPNDADLFTEEDIRSVLRTRRMTAAELCAVLRPKLISHPGNRNRLKELLRKIARLQNDQLVLRDEV